MATAMEMEKKEMINQRTSDTKQMKRDWYHLPQGGVEEPIGYRHVRWVPLLFGFDVLRDFPLSLGFNFSCARPKTIFS